MSEQPCPSEFEQPESCHYRYRTSDLHQMKTKKTTEQQTVVNLSTKSTINFKTSVHKIMRTSVKCAIICMLHYVQ